VVFARNEPSQSSHKYVLLRFGGENHLKAAIALLVNKQSATFLLRKKSGFSPPNPHTPWLVAFQQEVERQKIFSPRTTQSIEKLQINILSILF